MVEVKKIEKEQKVKKKDPLSNTLYISLTEPLFKRVYAISREFDVTMSQVARLCIETKLNDVQRLYEEIRKLKSGF